MAQSRQANSWTFYEEIKWRRYGVSEDEPPAMSPMFPATGLEKVIYPDFPNRSLGKKGTHFI